MPLVAMEVEDIVKLIFFVVFVFGSLIAKAIGSLFEMANKQRPRPVAGDVDPDVNINEQLAEFLRRATGGDMGDPMAERDEGPIEAWVQPDRAEVIEADVLPRQVRAGVPQAAPGAKLVQNDAPAGRNAMAPIRVHMDRGSVAQEARPVSSGISNADERFEHHLEEVFQTPLGQLSEGSSESVFHVTAGTDAGVWESDGGREHGQLAANIARLLQSPMSIRDAIVMSEVLRRPTDSW